MGKKNLTIIIPTFNVAHCIDICLDSISKVLNEVIDDIEIIVKDGASTDQTVNLVQNYQDRLPIKIVGGKDGGVYDAMNIALEKSQGKWIYFMGADDRLLPAFKSFLLNVLKRDANCVYANVKVKSDQSIFNGEFTPTKLLEHNICHQAMLYRRELFEQFGGYDDKYSIYADYAFNIRLYCSDVTKLEYIDEVVAIFDNSGLSGSGALDHNFLADMDLLFRRHLVSCIPLPFLQEKCHLLRRRNAIKLMDDGRRYFTGLKMLISTMRIGAGMMKDIYYIFGSFKKFVQSK